MFGPVGYPRWPVNSFTDVTFIMLVYREIELDFLVAILKVFTRQNGKQSRTALSSPGLNNLSLLNSMLRAPPACVSWYKLSLYSNWYGQSSEFIKMKRDMSNRVWVVAICSATLEISMCKSCLSITWKLQPHVFTLCLIPYSIPIKHRHACWIKEYYVHKNLTGAHEQLLITHLK